MSAYGVYLVVMELENELLTQLRAEWSASRTHQGIGTPMSDAYVLWLEQEVLRARTGVIVKSGDNVWDSDIIRSDEIPELGQEESGGDRKFGLSIGADPLTAGFNATAAFFNFLSTTQGQRVVERIIAFDDAFVKTVYTLFMKIQGFISKKV